MVDWGVLFYYAGYAVALVLCRGLGNLFFLPMLANIAFNISLQLGLLTGWDIRWIMVGYGFAFFVWVAALAGTFDRTTVIVLLLADLATVFTGIQPQLAKIGDGGQFWNATSMSIMQVWIASILIVSLSAIVKSSIVSKIQLGYSEVLLIPKRRFLIPIALWSAVILLPDFLGTTVPTTIHEKKFVIAGNLLVWGWVAFELPFYLMYKRMPDDVD